MEGDEYSFVGGGSLKLKGVKDSKVDKRKKRKHKKPPPIDEGPSHKAEAAASRSPKAVTETESDKLTSPAPDQDRERLESPSGKDDEGAATSTKNITNADPSVQETAKTDAEIRHEERRRKMLYDRLKREGNKSHKERVEELNRYLSGLSEHHDMPRIGPG